MSVLTNDCNVITFQRTEITIPSFLNIITSIHHPIIRINILFLELIHILNLFKIEGKSIMIYLRA